MGAGVGILEGGEVKDLKEGRKGEEAVQVKEETTDSEAGRVAAMVRAGR